MKKDLPSLYQQFIHRSRYSRWLETENRRESWHETVTRSVEQYKDHLKNKLDFVVPPELEQDIYNYIFELKSMPSMRYLMTAGPALKRCHVAAYNCSYVAVDHPRAFDETLYILMCGTGVGFSVERECVEQLPFVSEVMQPTDTTIVVEDSKEGWAEAFKELIGLLYAGRIPKWDLSKLRPAGARLKTFGGRSSGPAPLHNLFQFCVEIFKQQAGKRLSSIQCHDIMCKVGDIVVVGGVRRSALISLSDLGDSRMRDAKSDQWWLNNSQRRLANNSACYTCKPDMDAFMEEWLALMKSGSGERGIFNRQASKIQAAKSGRRDSQQDFGTNPCSEIILRSKQFCNLTEVVVRDTDTEEDLMKKVRVATIMGTFQSTFTDFKYLRTSWKKNTEEERLLGVSLTGVLDHPTLPWDDALQERLRLHAVAVNAEYAAKLGIPVSTAITCVKPSGTVSQLVDSASGMHPRHASFYIRRVRGDRKDPLTAFLTDMGVPVEADQMDSSQNTVVFSFPMRAPFDAPTRHDLTALQQLELWLRLQRSWCEHKPSCTVYVKPHEWLEVGAWVYRNFDEVSGISFLPHSEHTYVQAPYEDITEEQFNELAAKMPQAIDWDRLCDFEKEDTTTGTQELACSGGVCEIVDIGK